MLSAEHECHSDGDCPKGISCLEPLGVIDQFSLSYELRYPQGSKKCYILAFDNGIEPRTGGGTYFVTIQASVTRSPWLVF